MAEQDAATRIWDMVKSSHICLLVTKNGARLRARPMGVTPKREEHALYLLTDARRAKDAEIMADDQVCLAFHTGSADYVSISGSAVVSDDRAKIRELWSVAAKAWWDSAEDPNIRVIKITPEEGEFWDGPGRAIAYVKMAAAAISGTRPDVGKTGRAAL